MSLGVHLYSVQKPIVRWSLRVLHNHRPVRMHIRGVHVDSFASGFLYRNSANVHGMRRGLMGREHVVCRFVRHRPALRRDLSDADVPILFGDVYGKHVVQRFLRDWASMFGDVFCYGRSM